MTPQTRPKSRVLLLAPNFFGYEHEMKAELERLGHDVDLQDVRPSNSTVGKAALRLRPQLTRQLSARYYDRLLAEYGQRDYDLVFVVKGEGMFPETVQRLRAAFPRARFVLYSYDSVRNNTLFLDIYRDFDKALSFDAEDSARVPGLLHEPLFYIRKYEEMPPLDPEQDVYDVSFIGSLHADRFPVVKRILAALPATARAFTFFFYGSRSAFKAQQVVNADFRATPEAEVSFTPLPHAQVAEVFRQSRSVIDVQHPSQTGLTMRTFELLGARKKVITTNASIITYDIYHPQNFCVIDRAQPVIPDDFLTSPYHEYPGELYRKYALREWIQRVIG